MTAGADVDEVAFLRREPVENLALEALPARLASGEVTWLVVTSAFTLTAFDRLGYPWERIVPPTVRVAAVGPTSSAAVLDALGRVDLVPDPGTGSGALAACFPVGSGVVLVPGPLVPADDLPLTLGALGWRVERLGVYETSPVGSLPGGVVNRWRAGAYDALVVTSGSVAEAAARLLGTARPQSAGLVVVALGAASAEAAHRVGFARVVEATSATPDAVVTALAGLVGR